MAYDNSGDIVVVVLRWIGPDEPPSCPSTILELRYGNKVSNY